MLNGVLTLMLCAAPQEWMPAKGQSSAGAHEVAAGLGDTICRPAPATVSFTEFIHCFQWCITRCSGLHDRSQPLHAMRLEPDCSSI